jgi:hypothetical protein
MAGQPPPYEFLEETVRAAGLDRSEVEAAAAQGDRYALLQKLRPYDRDILANTYHRIAEVSRNCGARPIAIFIPRPEKFDQRGFPELEADLARDAGMPFLDLSGAYEGAELSALWIARWDHHPNADGTRMLAARLHQVLKESEPSTGFPVPPADAGPGGTPQEVERQ